jgi:hypothetical protein
MAFQRLSRFAALWISIFFVPCLYSQSMTCPAQSFTRNSPPFGWVGTADHLSGAHNTSWFYVQSCTYSNPAQIANGAACDTDESYSVGGIGSADTGSLNEPPFSFHQIVPATKDSALHATGAGTTSQTADVGFGVFSCLGTCGNIHVTVPPVQAGGGTVVETHEQSSGSGGCAVRHIVLLPPPCVPSPCHHCPGNALTTAAEVCSPLMFDMGGMGPFSADRHNPNINTSGTDTWELSDIAVRGQGRLLDIACTGTPLKVSWPKPGSKMVVLVHPGRGDKVKDCTEIFGNKTPQMTYLECGTNHDEACPPQGFLALRSACEALGGCANKMLTKKDALYSQLRILRVLPNGEEQLMTLPDAGVHRISLAWQDAEQFTDSLGNVFRYEGILNATLPTQRWIYDVFLKDEPVK